MILRTILTFLALTSFGMGVKAQVEMPLISDAPQNGNWAANTTWYQISLKKNGYLSSNANNSGYLTFSGEESVADTHLWCIVGNNESGYTFYNKEKGPNYRLGMQGAEANAFAKLIDSTNGYTTTFDFTASKATGYWCIKAHGTTNNYWNERSGRLAYWADDWAVEGWGADGKGDDGSAIKFKEARFVAADPVMSLDEATGQLSITCSTNGATIHYNINNGSYQAYNNPFDVADGDVVNAYATRSGYEQSQTITKVIVLKTPAPVITIDESGNVSITAGEGATIYYTTDGSTPTEASTSYYKTFPVTNNSIVKAIAIRDRYSFSVVATALYSTSTTIEGSGTEQDPYQIYSQETLAAFGNKVKTQPNAYAKITGSFSASNYPISEFTGVLDGGFHTITGLGNPLFSSTNGAIIKNVVLKDVAISGANDIGAIVGTASGETRIYNCGVLSGEVGGGTNVGSIAGRIEDAARVINCYSFANITSGNTVGGIVGYNAGSYVTGTPQTMVMNCAYYGNLNGGANRYPIFGGNNITNNQGDNTYNFFRHNESITYKGYNSAQAIFKDEYLDRFEFYRSILNSHRELAAYYAFNDVKNAGEIGKWTLDKSRAPYPIVTKHLSNTHKTLDRAIPNTQEDYAGKKIKDINVTININGKQVYDDTLPVTDMDTARWDYTYGKIVLPFANEFTGWSIGNAEAITGWKVSTKDYYQDLNNVFNNENYVYAQGGNYIVPEGVTDLTLTAYVAPAVYLSDASYDVVYGTEYNSAIARGGSTPTTYKEQTVYNTLSAAIAALPYSGENEKYPYKQAIVLVGNFHFNQSSGIEPETFPNAHGHSSFVENRPFTLMSADNDFDQEPDYCFYQYHCHGSGRSMVHPIRFDFLTSPGIGMAAHIEEGTKMPSIGIWHGKGWFEQTETFLAYMTECELRPANYLTDSPWILNGGIFERIVVQTTNEYDGGVGDSKRNENHLTYLKIGGNAYINELHPGTHSGYADLITLKPIYVSGGEIAQCYMTGKETNTSADTAGDINFYCNGGYIHEFLGAYIERQNGSINVRMDHGVVDDFFGGGANESYGTNGDISLEINNSYIKFFCGGPKYGNMATGKTITIVANGTTFGEFYGGGYGGTALTREQEAALAGSGLPLDDDKLFPLSFDNYTSKRLKNTNGLGVAVGYNLKFSYYAGGNGLGVSNFDVDYARLSLAQTNQISSTLNNCTVLNDFYGGGCQGRVKGNITSELTNCSILGDAFAGGYTAAATPISVYPTDPPTYSKYIKALGSFTPFGTTTPETYKWKQATDGHAAGTVDTENKYIYTDVDMSKMGEVNGQTTIVIKGNSVIGDAEAGTGGSVFGGGNASKVIGNTHVHIQGGTINGNVFGAGNQAEVTGKTEVVIGGECKLISNAK